MKPGRLTANPVTAREWHERSVRAALQRKRAKQTPKRRRVAGGVRAGETQAREAVAKRAGDDCEIRLPGCTGKHEQWSHRKRKGQGGRWCPANGLAACHLCHLAITDTRGRRAEYIDKGWLVNRDDTPRDRPVLIGGEYVLLSP